MKNISQLNETSLAQEPEFPVMKKRKIWLYFIPVPIILLFVGGFFLVKALRSGGISSPVSDADKAPKSAFNFRKEKGDVASPINGVWYTTEEAKVWQEKRPIAIMINNAIEARPQSGLPYADIIYEAVAEGGITRFLAVYQTQEAKVLGPVRSARAYYIDWAREYDAWYAHCGGATSDGTKVNIYDYINGVGYYQGKGASIPDLDEMWLGSAAYYRSSDRVAPHNLYTSTEKLREAGMKKYPTWASFKEPETWSFKEDADAPSGTASISFNFWQDLSFNVNWAYDSANNVWLRSQGGEKQTDKDTGQQLTAKVVIVQYVEETSLNDDKAHLWYDTQAGGDAEIYQDGKKINATWKKPFAAARTMFYEAASDTEIEFNRGQIWVEIVPKGNKVTFTSS